MWQLVCKYHKTFKLASVSLTALDSSSRDVGGWVFGHFPEEG